MEFTDGKTTTNKEEEEATATPTVTTTTSEKEEEIATTTPTVTSTTSEEEANSSTSSSTTVTVEESKIGVKLAPFNPTHPDAIEIAINLLEFVEGDIVYDLGCGDGRFLIQACQKFPFLTCYGIEYDRDLCTKAIALISANNLTSQINIIHNNVLDVDISNATVLFIYLVPEGILKLKDTLISALMRGSRIATYVFSVPGLKPVETVLYKNAVKIYFYTKASIP